MSTYHYVMSGSLPARDGRPSATAYVSGTVSVEPGASRFAVFQEIQDMLRSRFRDGGYYDDPTVTFWDLEPDTLTRESVPAEAGPRKDGQK